MNDDPCRPPKACKRLPLPLKAYKRRSTSVTKASKRRSTCATKEYLVNHDPHMPPKACKRPRLPQTACERRSTHATKGLYTQPSPSKGLSTMIHVCHHRLLNDTSATKGSRAAINVCHQRLVNDYLSRKRLVNDDPRMSFRACKRHSLPQKACERRST